MLSVFCCAVLCPRFIRPRCGSWKGSFYICFIPQVASAAAESWLSYFESADYLEVPTLSHTRVWVRCSAPFMRKWQNDVVLFGFSRACAFLFALFIRCFYISVRWRWNTVGRCEMSSSNPSGTNTQILSIPPWADKHSKDLAEGLWMLSSGAVMVQSKDVQTWPWVWKM